ncbi:fatty acid desaturase family protein [Algoriphagus algorifonticola]|uniref:fatty acid desaturase family protein n=1 Tax=Algoriphagus algorifonticola TaxID=2593007 RepID=UPI00164264AB|nr:acyl-CoA desaturase [Algoriphagus algorifonticola]
MKHVLFEKRNDAEFSKTLNQRVNDYFSSTNHNRFGGKRMVIKTVFMLSLFFVPLVILSTGIVSSVGLVFALYICSGLGMAGVGMGVMHDAIHGSYSKNPTVNRWVGYTMNLIGANANVWKIQHNVLHHTYTNIDQEDDDINAPFFLRFSPNAKRYWIHRFQHLYIWFFYGLSTFSWITLKDYVKATRYRKMGFFPKKGQYSKLLMKITAWKLLYYSYALILPLLMIQLPVWIIVAAFLSMHFVTGIVISIVFQTAHILSSTSFPQANEKGIIEREWIKHQMATTSDYAPKSRVFSWLIGGLNFQVEHHLFPNICHIHYNKLAKIVSQTAKEFKIPYLVKGTFFSALWDHILMLRQLGRAN